MYRNQSWAMPPLNNCAVSSTLLASFLAAETWKRRECVSCIVSVLLQHFSLNGDLLENYHKTLVSWTGIDEISLITVNCSLQERGREGCKERQSNWQTREPDFHPHQSPAPLSTAPCNIHPQPVSQWTSQAVKPAGFTPKVLLVLLLSICSTTAPPCLSAYRQIRVCQTLQWLSKSDLRGPPHQPSHSLKEQMRH